jgi:hypothetical protein
MSTLTAGTRATAAILAPGTWQALSFANSWSNQSGRVNAKYRLLPLFNLVEVIGWIGHASISGASAINTAVPAAYQPASEQVISDVSVIVATNAYASSTEMVCLDVGTTGIYTLNALPAGTTQVAFHGFYSLDA